MRDAETCKDLEDDVLKWVKFSGMSWTLDSKGFFYSKFDAPETLKKEGDTMDKAGTETEKLKHQKVFYHRLGTKQEADVLIYKNDAEPDWMFDATVTNDGKYVLFGTAKDCDHKNLLSYADISTE